MVAFSLSILAGYGAAALDSFTPRSRRLFGFVYAVAAAAGVIGIGFAVRSAGDLIVSDARFLEGVVAGACLLAVGAFILWRGMPERRRLWLLIAVSVADLFIANVGVNLAPRRTGVPPAVVAVQAAVRTVGLSGDSVPGRVYNDSVLFEDYGMFVGIEDVSGSSPLRLARYAVLLADFPRDRLWRLAGVKQVLSSEPELYVPTVDRIEIATVEGMAYLHQLAAANPRAWVVHSVRVLDDAEVLPLLGDVSFDPEAMALLAPPAVLGLDDGSLAPAGANVVRLERVASDRLVAHVRSDYGGLLVVSENWLPGWRARAIQAGDPSPHDVPVLRADLTFLGIPVRAGESTIELVYWPDSVRYGMGISGAALLVLAGVGGYRISAGRRRKARDGGQASATGGLRLTQRVWRLLATRLTMPSILLVALALRAFRLGYQELRGDEALGWMFSLEPFGQIIRSTIDLLEPHPVASYFLQKVWLGWAGHTEFALRFTSLFFGVLAVALLYRLGRRLGLGLSASALGAALLASSPYAIWHSQDARMYSMSLALTTASTLLMLESLARRRLRYWATYVGVTWLALHTHYYAAYIIIAQNFFVIGRAIWMREEWRRVLPWLLAQAATGILYLPWLLVARANLTSYTGNGDSPGFFAMWLRSLSVFAAGESVPDAQRALLACLAAVLAAIGAVRLALAGRSRRRALWLIGLYFCVPLLATWLGALSRPIFNERYLVAALPGFHLLVAAAVFAPARGERKAGLTTDFGAVLGAAAAVFLVVLVGASALSLTRYYADPTYSKTHGWRLAAALLERYSSGWPAEKVRVAQTYPEPTLWYYYRGATDHLVLPPAAHDAPGAASEVADLVRQGVERVVVMVQRMEGWDDQDIAPQALAREYTLLAETRAGDLRVQVYDRPPASLSGIDVLLAGGVRLTGASIPASRLVAGDLLPVYLRWDGLPAALSGSEKITLQLLDADGKLVTQTDHPFGQAELSSGATRYIITLPRELGSGTYRLIAALYDPSKPNAPRRLTVAGSDHVELALLSTQ